MTNWKGESRKVAIGRLKVETRPMIMVEFQGKALGVLCKRAALSLLPSHSMAARGETAAQPQETQRRVRYMIHDELVFLCGGVLMCIVKSILNASVLFPSACFRDASTVPHEECHSHKSFLLLFPPPVSLFLPFVVFASTAMLDYRSGRGSVSYLVATAVEHSLLFKYRV